MRTHSKSRHSFEKNLFHFSHQQSHDLRNMQWYLPSYRIPHNVQRGHFVFAELCWVLRNDIFKETSYSNFFKLQNFKTI